MKKDFQAQFESMRKVISSNISSIQSLLTQSEELSAIVCKIQSIQDSPDVKTLVTIRENIDSQLQKLVQDTLDLYRAYEDLTNRVFK